jgi:hypothetical protein
MNENKKITITGTSNRYQINKLKKEPIIIKKKKDSERWGIPIEFFEESYQMNLLNDLITYRSSGNYFLSNLETKHYKIINDLIIKKIASYKQQDIIKKRLDINNLIGIDEVIDLLNKCQLDCYYCKNKVIILYDIVRESNQWTLDRINNDIGHNSGNCIISCLSCNLKRRRINADSYLFTKNLSIVKKESEGIEDLCLNNKITK